MELEEEETLGRSTGKYYKATTRAGYGTATARRGGMVDGARLRKRSWRWGLWGGAWVKSTRLRRGGGRRRPSHELHTEPDWEYLQLRLITHTLVGLYWINKGR